MLTIHCEKCNGAGSNIYEVMKSASTIEHKDCKECNGVGQIEADPNMKVYVNVYEVTREFGGNQEGGWYFNRHRCVETVPCKNKYSDEILEDLEKEHAYRENGNIYSVLGGTELRIYIERKIAESETREVPQYE